MYNRFEDAYNKEVETLENYGRSYGARIEALKAVKRCYKKDGAPFVALAKNFTGAKVRESESLIGGKVLVVSYKYETQDANGYKRTHYEETEIHTRSTEVAGIDPARVYRVCACLKPCYDLTLDEIEAEIIRVIARNEKWLEDNNRKLTGLKESREFLAGVVDTLYKMVEETKDREAGDHLGNYHYFDVIKNALP